MTYIVFVAGTETARATNATNAAAVALELSRTVGADSVTVESHGVYGPFAEPELVGKAFVNAFDWQKAVKELRG